MFLIFHLVGYLLTWFIDWLVMWYDCWHCAFSGRIYLLHLSGVQAHIIRLCFLFSRSQPFEASDLLLGLNFSKVLSSLVALNKVTAGQSTYKHWKCDIYDNCRYFPSMSMWVLNADTRSGVFIFGSFCSDISVGSDSVSARHSSSHRIKSFESLSCQTSLGRSSKLLQNQFRSLVRSALTNPAHLT